MHALILSFLFLTARAEMRPAAGSLAGGGTRGQMITRDGLKLSYTRFGDARGPKPIVVSPGRGESAYRYEELSQALIARGFGPVFVLEHRNQGYSERTIENKDLVHVDRFEDYATDLTDFITEVVRRPGAPAPFLIAHSMGGAVANMALLQNPGLASRVAYVAPMLDINTSWLNVLRDRPAYWLTQVLCAVGFCDELALAKVRRPGPRQPPALHREEAAGIYSSGVTPGWLREAIEATWTLRDRAAEHREPSLFLIAKYDRLVQNEAVRAYVCSAQNCRVQEIAGSHSLHLGDRSKAPLIDAISTYFDTCEADLRL